MKDPTFLERIREIGRMTPSEARIAEHMEGVYPMVALETITTICKCANVGRATVVRFIQKLGYASYSQFQHDLHSEILERLQPPHEELSQRPTADVDLFKLHCEQTIRNIREAGSRNDHRSIQKAARILAGCKGDIFIMGHRTSFALATFFHYQLAYLRDGVRLCSNFWGDLPNSVSRVAPEDLLFLFFHSRYSRLSEAVAEWFFGRGCPIILLTDRESNPLSHLATLQLVAPSKGLGFFDSRAATFAVFEAISYLVAVELKDQLKDRFEKLEDATNAFGVFSDWGRHKSKGRIPSNAGDSRRRPRKNAFC